MNEVTDGTVFSDVPAAKGKKSKSKKTITPTTGTPADLIMDDPKQDLLRKARAAMDAFFPLLDKLPQDVAFAEPVATKISSPRFRAYCADSGIGTILPPSHIIRHLEAFEKNPLESASTSASHNPAEKGKGKFKRPASPSLMSFDRNVRSKVTKGERKQPSGKSSADSGIASNVGSPASSSSSFSGGPGATPASDQAALKARLQAKLLEFRNNRKAFLTPEDSYEARQLRQKLKKLKKKEKARVKKSLPKKGSIVNGPVNGQPGSSTPSSQRSSSIISEEGRMIFSKFDFFEPNTLEGSASTSIHPKQPRGKNLTHLLNKAEADRRKMDDLEKTDESEAIAAKQKKSWQEALLKAQGVKLKNDPTKLKKALKEQKKKKERSKKKWEDREGHIKKEQKEKQEKRNKNIQNRQEKRKDKKRKKAIKKGHVIPGFN